MGTSISSEQTAAFAAFGLLNFGKGVGNVLAGPISGALISHLSAVNVYTYEAVKYEAVVLFMGSCMFLSAVVVLLSYVKGFKF